MTGLSRDISDGYLPALGRFSAGRTRRAASHYCSTMYERAGPPWDTRRVRRPHRTAYMRTRVSVRMYHKRGGRASAHALSGGALLWEGRGGSRDPVRQLLTGLSHPAREKDHLARRADISNDTAARLFGLPLSSFGVQSPPPFSPGPRSFPVVTPLAMRACTTRGRSPSSPRRGLPRTRFGNCTRFAASSYPPCRGTFLRKAPPACTVTF